MTNFWSFLVFLSFYPFFFVFIKKESNFVLVLFAKWMEKSKKKKVLE